VKWYNSIAMKKDISQKVRTRFAPSPTGFLHIGSLRTALYAYALAKHNNGDFVLRIEDTDQKREVAGATDALQTTLKKFGLVWDEYYVQSERKKEGLYQKAAEKLVVEGHAFYCQCQAKNAKSDGFSTELRDPCRDKGFTSGAIKLRVPDGEILSYFDFVHRKEISWNPDTVYDATLLKSDGFPTYHLAVAVDDIDMKITHVLRAHDWLPSTPIHLLTFQYVGGFVPQIGHATDILSAETGKKLSKRRDSVFVEQFLEEGYLPEALLNFIMLLGWAPKDNRETYTLSEFVDNFDINGFQNANPRFLREKLDWFNGYYIRQMSEAHLCEKFEVQNPKFKTMNENIKIQITKLVKERIKKITEFESYAKFFWERPEVDKSLFGLDYKRYLEMAEDVISNLDNWELQELNDELMEKIKAENVKVGDFYMSMRVAITGSKFTPPINESMIILGKEETLKRLEIST
jgi:glutamyl-tRNA synthetase